MSNLKQTGVRMSPELIKLVKQYALDHDTTIQAVVTQAVIEKLERSTMPCKQK